MRASRGTRAVAIQLALLFFFSLCSAAHADDEREAAARDFREGTAAFSRGDYAAAAQAFASAFRRRPHGAAAYNAGLAWEAAADAPRAADAYDAALRHGGLEQGESADAERRLRNLDRLLGRVEVTAPPGARVTLGHAEAVAAPAGIHLAPGSYQVRVDFGSGRSEARAITVAAGTEQRIAFEEATVTPQARAPDPVTKPAPSIPREPQPDARRSSLVLTVAVVALGCSALAAGAAIGLGTAGLDAKDEYDSTNPPHTDVDLYDRSRALRTWANVSWTASAVLAAAGGTLLVVALSSNGITRRTASVSAGPRSIRLSGHF